MAWLSPPFPPLQSKHTASLDVIVCSQFAYFGFRFKTGITTSYIAMRAIFKKQYSNYQESMKLLKLDTLEIRRQKLNIKFARNCLKIDKLKNIFPLNDQCHTMEKRNFEKFQVNKANTERYRQSSIPYMQRLMNSEHQIHLVQV